MGLEPDTVVQVLLRERVRLVSAVMVVVRDAHAADDVFQQVVLAALEHRATIRDPEHLLAWALRAGRHRALDHTQRKRLRSLSPAVLDLLEADWGDPAGVGSPEQVEALRACLEKLGGPARELLRLKYFEGLTMVAIADRLRRTTDAVYQTFSRLHRSLRECVSREFRPVPVADAEGGTP